jgi:phosphate transport system permease protein
MHEEVDLKTSDMENKMLRRAKRVKGTDKFMTGVFYAVGCFSLVLIVLMAGYIIIKGFSSYFPGILSTKGVGIGNQLFNSIYIVVLSLLISGPLGILAGIYMAEYAREGKLTRFIRVCIESLSSLPSIVVGLFGYLVFILMTGAKWNLFAGAMAVSILSLPLITTTTEDAIRSLPKVYKEGSMGLGATHWETITRVLLPASAPRIVTGIILAAGRGFGETAALLYTAGQSTKINWSNWDISSLTCPLNPFRPGETLALHIWGMRTEGSLNPQAEEIANFSAGILVLTVLFFSLLARYLTKRFDEKKTGKKK